MQEESIQEEGSIQEEEGAVGPAPRSLALHHALPRSASLARSAPCCYPRLPRSLSAPLAMPASASSSQPRSRTRSSTSRAGLEQGAHAPAAQARGRLQLSSWKLTSSLPRFRSDPNRRQVNVRQWQMADERAKGQRAPHTLQAAPLVARVPQLRDLARRSSLLARCSVLAVAATCPQAPSLKTQALPRCPHPHLSEDTSTRMSSLLLLSSTMALPPPPTARTPRHHASTIHARLSQARATYARCARERARGHSGREGLPEDVVVVGRHLAQICRTPHPPRHSGETQLRVARPGRAGLGKRLGNARQGCWRREGFARRSRVCMCV